MQTSNRTARLDASSRTQGLETGGYGGEVMEPEKCNTAEAP